MSYISDAKRERARWMTLAEALAHVAERDRCDRRSALKQLRDALSDRKLHPKWEDSKNPAADWPPNDAYWQGARIQRGRVFDPVTRRWRTLLILKHSIVQLWSSRSDHHSGAMASAANDNPIGGNRCSKRRGRPNAEMEIHQALDQLSQRGRNVKDTPRKELGALVEKECGRRWCLRTVQKHTSTWLKKH